MTREEYQNGFYWFIPDPAMLAEVVDTPNGPVEMSPPEPEVVEIFDQIIYSTYSPLWGRMSDWDNRGEGRVLMGTLIGPLEPPTV